MAGLVAFAQSQPWVRHALESVIGSGPTNTFLAVTGATTAALAQGLWDIGFDACDYSAGKIDWLAAGLSTIRAEPAPRRALDAADRYPATCSPDTPVARLPTTSVIVVNEGGVVLGRVPPGGRDRVGQSAVAVMEPGPTTVRAHEPLDDLLDRMTGRNVQEIIVTTPEGRLLGVVHRDEQP